MGVYNSVYVQCPSCKESIELQSKTGGCSSYYDNEPIPEDIAEDLNGDFCHCYHCEKSFKVMFKTVVTEKFYIELES